jgi:hypothetical protein
MHKNFLIVIGLLISLQLPAQDAQLRGPDRKGPYWARPSIFDGNLYVRHGDVLLVYNLKS